MREEIIWNVEWLIWGKLEIYLLAHLSDTYVTVSILFPTLCVGFANICPDQGYRDRYNIIEKPSGSWLFWLVLLNCKKRSWKGLGLFQLTNLKIYHFLSTIFFFLKKKKIKFLEFPNLSVYQHILNHCTEFKWHLKIQDIYQFNSKILKKQKNWSKSVILLYLLYCLQCSGRRHSIFIQYSLVASISLFI